MILIYYKHFLLITCTVIFKDVVKVSLNLYLNILLRQTDIFTETQTGGYKQTDGQTKTQAGRYRHTQTGKQAVL